MELTGTVHAVDVSRDGRYAAVVTDLPEPPPTGQFRRGLYLVDLRSGASCCRSRSVAVIDVATGTVDATESRFNGFGDAVHGSDDGTTLVYEA